MRDVMWWYFWDEKLLLGAEARSCEGQRLIDDDVVDVIESCVEI